MTSGRFHIIPIGDINVERENRQRREITDIESLADSIRRLGLIHPLVVTRSFDLIAGERRYNACMKLGWITVPVQYVDEVDPRILKAIELEENIKRKDIDWRDQARAVLDFHRTYQEIEGNEWTQNKTSGEIGISQSRISELINVAVELEKGNEAILNAPKLSVAEGILRRATERRLNNDLVQLHRTFEGVTVPEFTKAESILTEDFNTWVLGEPQIRFNFIHCDFPYGIGSDYFNQGGAAAHGGYEDTSETWERLMFSLEIATRDHTAQSAHLMFWFAMRKADSRLYEPTCRRLEAIGWDVNPQPLIWMKSDGAGILPDPERGPRQIYETCLFASRGDRKVVRAVANAYAAPTVRDRHMSEKPEPMLRHFFGMLVDENTIMLDPTCGSGSALRAAESLGAKYFLGLEINSDFAQIAREELERFRTKRKAMELTNA
jgi:ParB family transcriptional regulator, chromosome partitioning protein